MGALGGGISSRGGCESEVLAWGALDGSARQRAKRDGALVVVGVWLRLLSVGLGRGVNSWIGGSGGVVTFA